MRAIVDFRRHAFQGSEHPIHNLPLGHISAPATEFNKALTPQQRSSTVCPMNAGALICVMMVPAFFVQDLSHPPRTR